MTLDEYKAYVEATRKESLLKAIATMSEANDKMSSLFNTKAVSYTHLTLPTNREV